MKDVLADLEAWSDTRIALATVVDVKRSAPRPPGAKMAVNDRGEVSGAVSGGCVAGAVVEGGEGGVGGGEARPLHLGLAARPAWGVGLPPGGGLYVVVGRAAAFTGGLVA